MGEIAADADAFAQAIGRRAARIRRGVVEADPAVDEIADRLREPRPADDPVELRPGKIAEIVAVAIAARQQVDENLARQFGYRRQRRILGRLVGRPAVLNGEIIVEGVTPGGGFTRVTPIPNKSSMG